jgi:predicted HicB family RNase H-like nuclease
VRVAGGDPELVYVEERSASVPTGDDALSARITLRLPEALKSIIDAAAQDEGVSANTWLLQQISRSANPKRRGPGGRRMSGYGRS